MQGIRQNILANVAGQGWAACMQLAFIPLYIKFLGIEAYGLIGFYAMLQGSLQVLDFGLSQTMNRELARYSVLPDKAQDARNFVRTLEVGYWAIGIIIGFTIFFLAPYIAGHWIQSDKIPISTIQTALTIMGGVASLQWPISFYQGGLMGLQHQVLLNSIKVSMATLNGVGAVIVLWQVSPTIVAFFTWQIFVNAIQVVLFTVFLWRSLPASHSKPRFSPILIQNIWRFAGGMSGITLSALILTQLDKIVLSNLLPLEVFGYYTLAGTVSGGLLIIINPLFNAIFPRFSALSMLGDGLAIEKLYHLGSQLMAAIILPMAAILSIFSFEILFLWTGSIEVAKMASPILSLLVIGTALNGLMHFPYALQLAFGWTSIGLMINTLLIVVLVPMIFFMTAMYGVVGAASTWIILNIIYMLICIPLTHNRLLKGQAGKWFGVDTGPPFLVSILMPWIAQRMIAIPIQPFYAVATLLMILICTLAATLFITPQIRKFLTNELSAMKFFRV